jgi:hypothetical protein
MQQQQRRFNPTAPPLDQRLIEEAQRLRKEARGTHPGIERERLIRRARQAETPARITEWLTSARPAAPAVMPEYRAYTVGDDGRFNGFEPFVCANDEEAITKAKILAQRHRVELWSGPRLISSIPKQPARVVTHEIHQGRMFPKPAT